MVESEVDVKSQELTPWERLLAWATSRISPDPYRYQASGDPRAKALKKFGARPKEIDRIFGHHKSNAAGAKNNGGHNSEL